MAKNPENYFMGLGKYAYDPFVRRGSTYIRVANRDNHALVCVFIVQNNRITLVSSTMPQWMVQEVMPTLERNVPFLLRWGLDA